MTNKKRPGKDGRLFPITTIDWDSLIAGHNEMYGTRFKTEKGMYLGLLKILSPRRMGDRLGVSVDTIYRRLDYYHIPRRHNQGGMNHMQAPKRDLLLSIPADVMAQTTLQDIVKQTGISNGYCSYLIRRHGRTFKRYDYSQRGW